MENISNLVAKSFNVDKRIIVNILDNFNETELNLIKARFTSKNISSEEIKTYYGDIVPKIVNLIELEKLKLNLTNDEYDKPDDDFISLQKYSTIIKKIRKDYYKILCQTLNPTETLIVLMSIVSIDDKYYSIDEISKILNINEDDITNILKNILLECNKNLKKLSTNEPITEHKIYKYKK